MTNQQHPITPSPELVEQWRKEWQNKWVDLKSAVQLGDYIATRAARWGADVELEACCKWTAIVGGAEALRAARRPKPEPTLKEQSLALLDKIQGSKAAWDISDLNVVRRALEALDD